MAVHVNSVISTTINDFDSAFYVKLTDMEEYVYTSSAFGEPHYLPFVQNLNDAIVSWMGQDRTALVSDAIQNMYSGHTLSNLYGGTSPVVDSRTIANMDGYRTDVLSLPVDAWNNGTLLPPSAPTLEAHIQQVTNSWDIEKAAWEALSASASGSVGGLIMQLLFEDVTPSNPPLSKQDMGILIFNTNNFKEVVEHLNANINLPAYV